jgi:hypothetical protein
LFGRATVDLLGSELETAWQFDGHDWEVVIAGDVETIRVSGDRPAP